MYRITILIFTILSSSCFNDEPNDYPEFYREYNYISKLIKANQLDSALLKFENARNKIEYIPSTCLFRISRACAEEGRCKLAAEYLRKAFNNGYEYGITNGRYKTIETCDEQIVPILNSEKQIHGANFNFKYKSIIDSLIVEDQRFRSSEENRQGMDVDSSNMIKLLDCIKIYGFPSEKIVGSKSAIDAFILLLHMDRDKNNKTFKPILDKAFASGQLGPRGYAWIIDRRRVGNGQEPYYYHMPSPKFDNFNEMQIAKINRRRDSIGLDPK